VIESPSRRRESLAILATIIPVLLLAGLADSVHELAWFVWYGGAGNLTWQQVAAFPIWLTWVLVATLVVRNWGRAATIASWLATILLVAATAFRLIQTTPMTEAWIVLALLATTAITVARANLSGLALVGCRRLSLIIAGVALVWFGRLLGHHYLPVQILAWSALCAVVVYGCKPGSSVGRYALTLLAAPAVVAVCVTVEMRLLQRVSSHIYTQPLIWLALYGGPVVVAVAAVLFLLRIQGMQVNDLFFPT